MADKKHVQQHIERAKAQREWFIGLVRRYEALARQNPSGYRSRVKLFGYLGYAYVVGVLFLVIALLIGMIALMFFTNNGNYFEVKLIFILGIIAVSIVKALFVKFEPPSSMLLSRAEAPKLYAEVDSIAERLQAPRPDEIRLDPQLNAAAQQTPRLGIFGWYRNVLHLGMPLLLSLSPDEARSVIAHELGHFSGQHGRFGAWAYRLGMTWNQLYDELHKQGGRGSWLFKGFVNWFVPRFEAMSFALRRLQEYEADRAAVHIAGAPSAARALMRLPYLSSHLETAFWEPFWDRSKEMAQPPAHAFAEMPAAARHAPAPDSVQDHLARALQSPTDYDDTHPSLSDRLNAMQQLPAGDLHSVALEIARPSERSSAEEFFGPALPDILERLELHYRPRIQAGWTEWHKKFQKFQADIDRLEALRQQRPLTEDEEVEYLVAVNRLRPPEESEPVLRSMIQRFPENAVAHYLLGELLLERDDPSGIEFVEESVRLAPTLKDASRKLLGGYYYRHREMEKFEALREEAFEAHTVSQLDEAEVSQVRLKDDYAASVYTEEELARMRERFEELPILQVAYAVSKPLPGGKVQDYIIAFPVRKFIERGSEGKELIAALTKMPFPRKVMVYTNIQHRKTWERKLSKIPGAKIYEGPKKR